MDAFFASCEQQARENLRGKPVGIAPYTGPSGCVIARSYEAKQAGIKVGMRVGEAKAVCPSLVIVESDTKKYLNVHQAILACLNSLTPFVKVKSVDEFRIKLTPSQQSRQKSIEFATQIKTAVNQKTGGYLGCSVGIGPSTFLAKMAADFEKPNGLTVLTLDGLIDFYSRLKLTDLTGINTKMERRLHWGGIRTPNDLYNQPAQKLREQFGIWGDYWYLRLRGFEIDNGEFKPRNLGHSHVLPPEFRTPGRALNVLQKLVEKAGSRLRKQGFWASGVYLNVRFEDRTGLRLRGKNPSGSDSRSWHKTKRVSPFCDSQTFFRHILSLYRQIPISDSLRPLLIAISAFNLTTPLADQLTLFPEKQRQLNLARSIDVINDRHGKEAVKPANLLGVSEAAPDRIPFGPPAAL